MSEIPEIFEQILLNLSFYDILRSVAVCRFWRDCITETPSLQRRLLKRATQMEFGIDPHFHQPVEVHRRLPVRDANLIVEAFHNHLWNHLDSPPSPTEVEREAQYSNVLFEQWRIKDHFRPIYEDPCVYPGRLHCRLCNTPHLQLRFENLHPLLHFLANNEVCFRGRISELALRLTFGYVRSNYEIEEDIRHRDCAIHTMSEMDLFAFQLREAHHAIRTCGIGNDLISLPICTRLVVLDDEVPGHYIDLRDEDGITLEQAVIAMAKRFESRYYTNIADARHRVRRWSELEDTMRLNPGFSQQSWDRRLRLRMETVGIYEEAGPRLHAIMQDLWGEPQ
jgi:hypothetical protein